MQKTVNSYQYLYYTLLDFYRGKWAYSREWPQGWAVVAISTLVALVFWGSTIWAHSLGFSILEVNNWFSWLPRTFQSGWFFILALCANGYYFLVGNRWKSIENRCDKLPASVKQRRHQFSWIFMLFLIIWFMSAILLFPG